MKLLLVICLAAAYANASENLVVETKYGPVRGTVLKSVDGEDYVGYMGIPFAKPPVGELRFKAPELPEKWTHELDGSKDGNVCLQHSMYLGQEMTFGEEDCLTLNIYVPKNVRAGNKLDVMFHIHGGAFMIGSGNKQYFDLLPLVAKGVIVVSVNYRLGILGFLSTGDDVVPGNNGLKDQVMAMKWTRDNIAAFGGNPDSVTIFGCSAGGMSVHAHYLSPMSTGLFHRAIAESGVITSAPMLIRNAPQKAKALAELLECPTESSQKMLECLRNKDGHALMETTKHFYEWKLSPIVPFGPVVEPAGGDRFFTKHPWSSIDDGDFAQVPFITGLASNEGGTFAAGILEFEDTLALVNSAWERIFQLYLEYEHVEDHNNVVAEKIRQFYFGGRDIDSTNGKGLMDAFGDRFFLSPMYKSVQRQASVKNYPTYVYLFDFRRETPSPFVFAPKESYDYGVAHGENLAYLTDVMFGMRTDNKTENEKKMKDIMTSLWTNFAKSGNPNSPDSSLEFKWDTVTADDVKFLHITLNPEMKEESAWPMDRINFWDIVHEGDLKITYESKHVTAKHDEF